MQEKSVLWTGGSLALNSGFPRPGPTFCDGAFFSLPLLLQKERASILPGSVETRCAQEAASQRIFYTSLLISKT